MERYRVRIEKDSLIFSVSHFIAFDRNRCERLHGHDYRAVVELTGELDENKLVYDFVVVERLLGEILSRIDHRTLLPLKGRHLQVMEGDTRVKVAFGEKEWIFPREDCVLLPVVNTTAEELAAWIAGQLLEGITRSGLGPPECLTVQVGESTGHSALYEISLEDRQR